MVGQFCSAAVLRTCCLGASDNCTGVGPESTHTYESVNYPAIIKEYNEHMGGVDLFDMLMSL